MCEWGGRGKRKKKKQKPNPLRLVVSLQAKRVLKKTVFALRLLLESHIFLFPNTEKENFKLNTLLPILLSNWLSSMPFENGRSFLKDKLFSGPLEGHNPRTNTTGTHPKGTLTTTTPYPRFLSGITNGVVSWEHISWNWFLVLILPITPCAISEEATNSPISLWGWLKKKKKSYWLAWVVRITENKG